MNLQFKKGEIHALVGQNGAGKSTLIKICSGAISPSSGRILIGDRAYDMMTPQLSDLNGIAVVYQELNLVNELSVAENIYLGQKLTGKIIFHKKALLYRAAQILKIFKLDIPANTPVKELSTGYQQIIQIVKALSHNASIIIMDEPSASLSNTEVKKLFEVIHKLKDMGVTVIYISHRLDEIFHIADRVTVLRDGSKIRTLNISESNKDELITLMIGHKINEVYPPYEKHTGDHVILETRHLSGNGLNDISFQVKQGEVLALGGLVGSGRTALAQLLIGDTRPDSGEILVHGRPVKYHSPQDAINQKIVLVPEERKAQGLFLNMSIEKNISLPSVRRLSRGLILNHRAEKEIAAQYAGSLQVKASNLLFGVNTLSGGNQQKIILAKWMATEPEIIVLDEPTRGIDVGAKYEIYVLMKEMIKHGKTLILISSEIDELIHLADRMIILSEGKITANLPRSGFDQETILRYASKSDKAVET